MEESVVFFDVQATSHKGSSRARATARNYQPQLERQQRATSNEGDIMNRIFSYIKQFKWYFIVGTSFIFISIGLDMLSPWLMKVAIDEIIIGGRMELLATVLAALMGITITRAVLGYSKELLFD